MKKIVILIIIILMAAGCNKGKNNVSSRNTENKNIEVGIEEGNIAPDIELFTLSGEKKYLKDFAGKIVMLNFWATWCPPCRSEMPSIENFYKKIVQNKVDANNNIFSFIWANSSFTVRERLRKQRKRESIVKFYSLDEALNYKRLEEASEEQNN